jgi:hypothetical protein
MASARNERRVFQTDGPKRRRRTRRDFGYGQISMWRTCQINFKREREAKRAPQIGDFA